MSIYDISVKTIKFCEIPFDRFCSKHALRLVRQVAEQRVDLISFYISTRCSAT